MDKSDQDAWLANHEISLLVQSLKIIIDFTKKEAKDYILREITGDAQTEKPAYKKGYSHIVM